MNQNVGIIRVSDIWENVKKRFEAGYSFEQVTGGMDADVQRQLVTRNYATVQRQIDDGMDDWKCIDPYEIADWLRVLTEHEFGAWQDIRSNGLPLWPRLPVGEFVVNFGNPAAKVALQVGIESDGVGADELRADHWLKQIGWRVFRVSHERCTRVMDTPADVRERTGECDEDYRARYLSETLAGVMQDLRHALIATGAM